MADRIAEAVAYVQASLAAVADSEKAAGMQAYMKTDMPFYGVQKPQRTPIHRHLIAEFPPTDHREYEELVLGLWTLPHREEKYLAIDAAEGFREYVVPESLPLYRRLIVEGAWWDFVDSIAIGLVGRLVVRYPAETWSEVDGWVDSDGMWLRRSAIICQVGAREKTDVNRLFDFCAARSHEKEFFIRKGIGWALRDYARTDPQAVAAFALAHRDSLSGLSFREATKHIQHLIGESDD